MILVPTHKPSVYLHVREGIEDDFEVIREIWCEDVYHVADKISNAKFILDIGANIGSFTCFALENSNAEVWAIEPEKNNLELLKLNIGRVNPAKAKILEVAVSDYEGKSKISDGGGSSRLADSGQEVWVTTIDKILQDEDRDIDIFKIDIEGSEVGVLLSLSKEVQERVKFFAIEFDQQSKNFGKIVEKLSETHHVQTLGAASRGAMIYAERY